MGIWVLAVLALVALLVWTGRRPVRASLTLRLGSGLLSALAAGGALVSMFRGGWPISLALMALSAWMAHRARTAATGAPGGVTRMSEADARSILGVGAGAAKSEIEEAYRRLMRRAHPDAGGSAGLAAQLNAARDRLLKS